VKPVTVSIEVPNPPEQVYDFLEVLGNHESFSDHFLLDWELSGPSRGVGAKANVRVKASSDRDWTDIELVETERPRRLVEESVGGSKAGRRARGTYTLEPLENGGTRVSFEYAYLEIPFGERIMGPVNRAYLKRVNGRSLKRLAEQLPAPTSVPPG
jgi:polyketide cyclase/dehydrase/lipid transport protein